MAQVTIRKTVNGVFIDGENGLPIAVANGKKFKDGDVVEIEEIRNGQAIVKKTESTRFPADSTESE